MKKIISGFVETVAGAIMIVVPEPATTVTGVAIVADGIRRIANGIEE